MPRARRTWGRIRRRARDVLREQGVRSLWFKVLGKTVYRRTVVFERTLDTLPVASLPPDAIDIGQLAHTEIDAYLRLRPDEDVSR